MTQTGPQKQKRTQTPEEHLAELIAVQQAESAIEKRRKAAQQQAQEILAQAEQERRTLRQEARRKVEQELAAWQDEEERKAQAEAQALLEEGKARAEALKRQALKRQDQVVAELLQALLAVSASADRQPPSSSSS